MPGKKSKYTNKNKKKYEPKNNKNKNKPEKQFSGQEPATNKTVKVQPPPRKHVNNNLVSCRERDFLEEDPPLRGQSWVCVSFLSPEDIIKRKESYFFETYLKHFSNEMNEFWVRMIEKYPDEKLTLLQIKDRFHHVFNPDEINEDYTNYYNIHSKELEDAYYEANDFQTSMRGVKIRGTFDNEPAARNRCDVIKSFDEKTNVWIATVGAWLPWSPNPEEMEDQEHAETQLNTLAKNYKENVLKRNQFYEERKRELLEQKNKKPQLVVDDKNTIIDPENNLASESNCCDNTQTSDISENEKQDHLKSDNQNDSEINVVSQIDDCEKKSNNETENIGKSSELSDSLLDDDPWISRKIKKEV